MRRSVDRALATLAAEITGIGQGFVLTTPLQLASATATLSEYGRHFKPHIVASTQQYDDIELTPVPLEPQADTPVEDLHHWRSVMNAMREVVNGKSGTAGTLRSHCLRARSGPRQGHGPYTSANGTPP